MKCPGLVCAHRRVSKWAMGNVGVSVRQEQVWELHDKQLLGFEALRLGFSLERALFSSFSLSLCLCNFGERERERCVGRDRRRGWWQQARMRGLQAQNSRWTAPKTLNPKPWRKESGKALLLALRNCEERKIHSCAAGTKAQPSFSSIHSIVSLTPGVASLLRTAGEKSSLSIPMRSCACLHTWWKNRVRMGMWAFCDRSRNISSEQSRIPGELWQWRQCLCIHCLKYTAPGSCELVRRLSSLLLPGCNKEKKLWIGIFFLWKIFKVFRASQEPVRVTYRYLEDDGTKVHVWEGMLQGAS